MRAISAKKIRDYARVCAAHNRLEKLRYKMRGELLALLNDGVPPSTAGPFVLVKSSQSRIDSEKWSWKMYSLELAIKFCQLANDEDPVRTAMSMILDAELSAPRKEIPVLSAKPNPNMLGDLLGK